MKITKTSSESNERIHVKENGQILLTVAPLFGAKLSLLKLKANDEWYDVLWETTDDDLENNTWYKQSILFPYPNRLKDGKYTFNGVSYQFPINEAEKQNQLHGLLYNEPFELVEAKVEEGIAIISLKYVEKGQKSYYPFAYDFTVTYRYSGDKLETSFGVTNKGASAMPFGIGWHPYFQINDLPKSKTRFEAGKAEAIELVPPRSLPTGKRTSVDSLDFDLSNVALDDAFLLTDDLSYRLQVKEGPALCFECGEGFDYLQVFTPEGEESIAIEPMTCNVNAFNNEEGLRVLAPADSFQVSVVMSVS
ncbi:MAG: hypothetical protein JXR10_01885 [Cyclobacteriaceae bacterium]